MPDLIFIVFFFALGACVGSFLNVVAWRLPRGESLVTPPSHCPKCNHKLAWFDNIPVFGWIFLGGKCRYCRAPISARYPIVEAITGLIFVFYYAMFFMAQIGPCSNRYLAIDQDWPIFGLYLLLLAGLFVSSLIDAELFIIPIEIPWLIGLIGVLVHTIVDQPGLPGALNADRPAGALAAGATIGLVVSIAAWWRGYLPTSFPTGEPMLEVDREAAQKEIDAAKARGEETEPLPPPYTRKLIRAEMHKEILFLFPPMIFGLLWLVLTLFVPSLHSMWYAAMQHDWISGLLGSLLGGLVGGFVVWLTRILGTLGFGRVAMGLGDVHLMFGVGAVIGAGASTVAFFIAPFFGLVLAIYMLVTHTRRELPYGPYLSLGTAFVILFYCPIAGYLGPGMESILYFIARPLNLPAP